MNKTLIKQKLIYIKNILENIGEIYILYEYDKPLNDIDNEFKLRINNLSLVKRHK